MDSFFLSIAFSLWWLYVQQLLLHISFSTRRTTVGIGPLFNQQDQQLGTYSSIPSTFLCTRPKCREFCRSCITSATCSLLVLHYSWCAEQLVLGVHHTSSTKYIATSRSTDSEVRQFFSVGSFKWSVMRFILTHDSQQILTDALLFGNGVIQTTKHLLWDYTQ